MLFGGVLSLTNSWEALGCSTDLLPESLSYLHVSCVLCRLPYAGFWLMACPRTGRWLSTTPVANNDLIVKSALQTEVFSNRLFLAMGRKTATSSHGRFLFFVVCLLIPFLFRMWELSRPLLLSATSCNRLEPGEWPCSWYDSQGGKKRVGWGGRHHQRPPNCPLLKQFTTAVWGLPPATGRCGLKAARKVQN